MTNRVRDADVIYAHYTLKPEAKCLGRLLLNDRGEWETAEPCQWSYTPNQLSYTGDAKKQAKNHVKACPGHQVEVTQRNVSHYRVEPADVG